MNYLSVITDTQQRKVWWRAFRIWQRKPHELAPLKEQTHVCASCRTSFTGNYCPRCGQSAKIGRFSFKKALLLFLDVWGLGNRGMFRSIRDLVLRPGYMIRDYISGMQSAYFPPFKMFFLLAALSLVIEHGFGLTEEGEEAQQEMSKAEIAKKELAKEGIDVDGFKMEWNNPSMEEPTHLNGQEMEKPMYQAGWKFAKTMNTLRKKNPAIFALLTLLLFSMPLFYFFRKAPAIPDLHFPEFFVALVYTANMFSIFSITGNLLNSGLLKLIAVLMIFVALKQFSGYSKRRVLGYMVLSAILSALIMIVLGTVGVASLYMFIS